jgi:hypothetical protein
MFIPLQFNKANLQRLLTALGTFVSSFSGGSTGLTPASPTTGAVVLGGTLNAASGGTGQAGGYAVGDVLYASSATALSKLADVATGNAIISGGVTTAPTYGKIGLTTHISGTLAVGNGGTGAATFTAHGVLLGNTAAAFGVTAVGTTGQLLTGVTGSDPVWAAAVNQSVTGPTTQNLTTGSGATYTTPAGVKWLKARYVGGGGGGGGVGVTTGPTGSTGGTTIFNSVNAVGGSGGVGNTNGTGAGASAGGIGGTGGTGTATMRQPGNAGGSGSVSNTAITVVSGYGAPSFFGGGAVSISGSTAGTGTAPAVNTGAGGAGAGGVVGSTIPGGGGGSGEYVELIISNPAGSYTYTIGAGGAGGIGTGTNAATGGLGGTGWITVEEHYNY